MSDIFDFHWLRDAEGYKLQLPKKESAGKGVASSILTQDVMRIVRVGGELKAYPPRAFDDLHRKFAETDPTPEGLLKFVNSFGFLGITLDGPQAKSESVDKLLAAQKHLRGAIEAFDELAKLESRSKRIQKNLLEEGALKSADINKNEFRAMAANLFNQWAAPELTAKLKTTSGNTGETLALSFVPRSLIGLMWLQIAEGLMGGAKYRACVHCGKSFEIRRSDRMTCSEACRRAKNKAIQKIQKIPTVKGSKK